eukprot:CAMPEP_0202364412 /NCGR_PEP_ID=MMETSP1126-20121109/15831_1 /ASSEMBLY_ACC=CAM_ASM_000457 /TAXON_ID=3047 /ORGANISM="Dunaliella tertiolecta, Strain CCMP1320" /LENGTH=130 /DNA_ID=CAMNT_0048959051 /DNA_START=52 /DNA_END=444 /DNA_ORIENTATION=+
MVRPFVTEGGDFVMCGSDDGAVYIWDRLLQMEGPQRTDSNLASPQTPGNRYGPRIFHKNPHFECFHTDEAQLTSVLALPSRAWRVRPEEAPVDGIREPVELEPLDNSSGPAPTDSAVKWQKKRTCCCSSA